MEKIFEYHLKIANIELIVNMDSSLKSYGYPTEFKQVMLNLVNNSKDAIRGSGAKKGWIRIEGHREGASIRVTVSDSGGGIPDVHLEKVFIPYFTTKEASGGTGIGLHIIRSIITEHMEGSITVHNGEEGAVFIIKVPFA